eukprot:gene15546-17772_t
MNSKLFKTVFSKRLGALVAVGEHATSQGKATGGHGAGRFSLLGVLSAGGAYFVGPLVFSFALITLAWAAPANNALPTGGHVAQGAAAISQSGANMAIAQSSARAIVNWQSFDIGKDAKVNIVQPNAQAVLLNRVTGVAPSQIFGQMSANGQVVLVNPNGVTFGKDGSVSAAGLTASTLNISDADFMAGRNRYTRDGATGEVINQGLLSATPGGYVALLGASVSNEGKIYAPNGNVALGAADVITLPMTGTGRIKMELSPAVINAAVANQKGGTIVTEGGQVYMQAAAMGNAMASVLQSGSIDTSGEQGGAVHLLADGGTIRVDGSINANSTGKDDKGQLRKGGDILIGRDEETGVLARYTDASDAQLQSHQALVETSGDVLKVDNISVKAGEWLLDPYNITIASATASGTAYATNYTSAADSVITSTSIINSLNAGTSVTIATGAGGTSAGNIAINASISKTGGTDATLTFRAHNDISLAANTTITSISGSLNVIMNSDFDANGQGAIVLNSGSSITSRGGNITLGGGTAGTGVGSAFGSSTAAAPTSTAAVTTTSDGITLNGTAISAGGGNITMTGTSNASNGSGINAINNSSIVTSGAGSISLTGTSKAGGGTASLNGVGLLSTPVTGGSGGVTIVGNASAATTSGAYTYGVMVKNSTVSTVNGGNISFTGTGGGGTANTNYGFSIDGSGKVAASGAGNVSITGAAANTSSSAININAGSGGIESITGNITLIADSVALNGTINGGTGTVTIQQRTGPTTLNVGGTGTDTLSGTLKLDVSAAELGRITAKKTVVGLLAGSGTATVSALNMGTLGNTGGDLSVLSGTSIAVNGAVTKTAGTDATFSLLARNDITVAANTTITGSSGKLNVLFNSDSYGSNAGSILMNSGSGVTSNGGNITLGGGSAYNGSGYAVGSSTTRNDGVSLTTASLNAGGGNIDIRGKGFTTSSATADMKGVDLVGATVSTSGTGNININGVGGAGASTVANAMGVSITGGTVITGAAGGSLNLTGAGGTGSDYNSGVWVDGTASKVTSPGPINFNGTGGGTVGGTGIANLGVVVKGGGAVAATGTGTVTMTGVGGNTTGAGNTGIEISGTNTSVTSVSGAMNFTGSSLSSSGAGFSLSGTGANITSTANANITVTSDSFSLSSPATMGTGRCLVSTCASVSSTDRVVHMVCALTEVRKWSLPCMS